MLESCLYEIVSGISATAPAFSGTPHAERVSNVVLSVATTDAGGRIDSYKIVDPSFHNWFGLALALRNGQISDFPLCNKSFNLSYCGFDL